MSAADAKWRYRDGGNFEPRISLLPDVPHDRRETPGDTALIRQAQVGRWESFAELAQRYDSTILALTLRLSRSEREARELFQKALLKAYRELPGYRFQCSFYLWIYRIVAAACIQFLEEGAERRDEAQADSTRRVDAALRQLSPRDRIVLELKHSFGLKLETVAAILQITHDSARNSFVRAVLLLRLECE